MAGTMFGIGTPNPYAISAGSWGLSPYGSPAGQGIGFQQQPWQQILQLVQIVPQQLQQVQALQQQQLLYLQQLLQVVPAQLQQLQQLIQIQQVQQPQPFQPLGQTLSGPLGFGLVPQVFAGQTPSHVM